MDIQHLVSWLTDDLNHPRVLPWLRPVGVTNGSCLSHDCHSINRRNNATPESPGPIGLLRLDITLDLRVVPMDAVRPSPSTRRTSGCVEGTGMRVRLIETKRITRSVLHCFGLHSVSPRSPSRHPTLPRIVPAPYLEAHG